MGTTAVAFFLCCYFSLGVFRCTSPTGAASSVAASLRTTYRSQRLFYEKATSHSFCRSSFPNRTRLRWASIRFLFSEHTKSAYCVSDRIKPLIHANQRSFCDFLCILGLPKIGVGVYLVFTGQKTGVPADGSALFLCLFFRAGQYALQCFSCCRFTPICAKRLPAGQYSQGRNRQRAAFQGAGRVQNELPRSVHPHKAGQINIFRGAFQKSDCCSAARLTIVSPACSAMRTVCAVPPGRPSK